MTDNKNTCLLCADTGIQVDGSVCSCGIHSKVEMPLILEIPAIYQTAEFSASLVPIKMSRSYGTDLEDIIDVIKSKGKYNHNILICSPPNTGKTVFSYTIYKHQYTKGIQMSELIDLIEAKELFNTNSYDESIQIAKNILVNCPIAIIKIPLDLPNKFAETMSTILERRVRKGGTTIFLYGGSLFDLQNQDRFGVLKNLIRDGSYNSIRVMEYKSLDDKEIK